ESLVLVLVVVVRESIDDEAGGVPIERAGADLRKPDRGIRAGAPARAVQELHARSRCGLTEEMRDFGQVLIGGQRRHRVRDTDSEGAQCLVHLRTRGRLALDPILVGTRHAGRGGVEYKPSRRGGAADRGRAQVRRRPSLGASRVTIAARQTLSACSLLENIQLAVQGHKDSADAAYRL